MDTFRMLVDSEGATESRGTHDGDDIRSEGSSILFVMAAGHRIGM